jgi:DNA-binding MurR/RpiR family transcriptional regulator
MSPLLKIRAERDQMSAIERRVADFILENAHLLRDYSSQQLADALRISQSSVVKFSQKLGFKGYPDLKYSIGEALGRSAGTDSSQAALVVQTDARAATTNDLWRCKAHAEEETRLINKPETIARTAALLSSGGRVFVFGLAEDGLVAQAFAARLALIGIDAHHGTDPALITSMIARSTRGDALLICSEYGTHPALFQILRQFRERQGGIVTLTRHSTNPLRAHADVALAVSAHDERPHVQPLLYQAAQQHVLDLVFLALCEGDEERQEALAANVERMRRMLEP